MTPLGFAIVGSGNVARLHAHALGQVPGARLVAVAGRNQTTALALAAEFAVEATTPDAVLARPDVDAIIICTPSGTHAELGIAAARAGKHVLVEKPIDVSLERARALIQACRDAKVKLGVVFQNRFLPEVQLLKRAIDNGRLGRVLVADGYVKWYRSPDYYTAAPWRGTASLDGGGALINQAIHTVDLLLHLVGSIGRVAGVTARQLHTGIEREDTALGLLRFTSGALGVIEATTCAAPGFSRRIELHGERGSIVLEGNAIKTWALEGAGAEEAALVQLRSQASARGDGAADPLAIDSGPHAAQLADFVRAIRTSAQPAVDGAEGTRALAVVQALYRAAETESTVTVEAV